MKKILKQAAGIFAVCVVLLQTGCKNTVENRPLLWYTEYSFPFEMTVPSADADSGTEYTLTGERTPTSVTLSVTSPEHLNGLTIRYAGGNCTISAGETVIPLSRSAASGLTVLLDGLLAPSPDGAKLGSSEDGSTTAAYDAFTITLDENGLPSKIRDADTGREAEIKIQSSDLSDTENKDQQK